MQQEHHPYLLPHERYLMKRRIKINEASARKRERVGAASAMLDDATSVDALIGFVFGVAAVLVSIPGLIVKGAVELTAVSLWGTSVFWFLIAAIRQVQSIVAYHRHRKKRNLQQLS